MLFGDTATTKKEIQQMRNNENHFDPEPSLCFVHFMVLTLPFEVFSCSSNSLDVDIFSNFSLPQVKLVNDLLLVQLLLSTKLLLKKHYWDKIPINY